MRRSLLLLSAALTVLSTGLACAQNDTPRNLILFIPVVAFGRWVETRFAWKR